MAVTVPPTKKGFSCRPFRVPPDTGHGRHCDVAASPAGRHPGDQKWVYALLCPRHTRSKRGACAFSQWRSRRPLGSLGDMASNVVLHPLSSVSSIHADLAHDHLTLVAVQRRRCLLTTHTHPCACSPRWRHALGRCTSVQHTEVGQPVGELCKGGAILLWAC